MGQHFTSSTENNRKGRTGKETEQQSDRRTVGEVSANPQLQNTEEEQQWHRTQLMETS